MLVTLVSLQCKHDKIVFYPIAHLCGKLWGAVIRGMESGHQLHGFQSHIYHLVSLCPWTSYFYLSILVYKKDVVVRTE